MFFLCNTGNYEAYVLYNFALQHKEKRSASYLCRRMQQSKIVPLGSHMSSIGGASGLGSSNSASEA